MILYGSPEEIRGALEDETAKLMSLKGKDPHLDKYIDNKLKVLKECFNKLKNIHSNYIQIIAISSCDIIELGQ